MTVALEVSLKEILDKLDRKIDKLDSKIDLAARECGSQNK